MAPRGTAPSLSLMPQSQQQQQQQQVCVRVCLSVCLSVCLCLCGCVCVFVQYSSVGFLPLECLFVALVIPSGTCATTVACLSIAPRRHAWSLARRPASSSTGTVHCWFGKQSSCARMLTLSNVSLHVSFSRSLLFLSISISISRSLYFVLCLYLRVFLLRPDAERVRGAALPARESIAVGL